MKKRILFGFLTTCAVCMNVPMAGAQEWHLRDPLDLENLHGIKQFQSILIPIGFVGSLLLTDAKHDSNESIGTIRPGSWFIHSRASYYKGYQSAGRQISNAKLVEGTIGFGYYFRKWLAAGMDFHATGFLGFILFPASSSHPMGIERNVRTVAVGGGPFVRWHLLSHGLWSLYFEQGVKVVFAKSEFPVFGTKTNFVQTYRLGMSLKLLPHIYFLVSVGHYHLSNGDIDGADRNPGFDANGIYMGTQVQF